MEPTDSAISGPLASLAAYLSARREAILNNWRTACQADPAVNTTAGLSREEFNNKVPYMLNEMERRLRQQSLEGDIELLASEHGLHRWQKGYVLRELLEEIQHLNQILQEELRHFWSRHPDMEWSLIARSYEYLIWFNNLNMKGSIEQYTELQRIAAGSRVETLQKALDELNELTRQRGDLLRTASHDLRSSFGVIQGSASFLNLVDASESERKQMVEMLNRNLTTVRSMVVQLMDLARLEAGQETLKIQSINAGELLHKLVESYQQPASEKGLLLKADGPTELAVESDPLQLQRIVQNLVLNVLRNTEHGWVSVSWTREGQSRWLISVQSATGSDPATSTLMQVLAPTTESNTAFGFKDPEADAREAAAIQSSRAFLSQSEGIGLSIVKKLCELLGANLEVETQPGGSTLFRIRLPIQYQR